MPKEISPTVVWVTIAVIVLVVVGIGYKMFGPGGSKMETGGSEATMQRVQKGERMYTPPAGSFGPGGFTPPGAGGPRPGGMPSGVPTGAPR